MDINELKKEQLKLHLDIFEIERKERLSEVEKRLIASLIQKSERISKDILAAEYENNRLEFGDEYAKLYEERLALKNSKEGLAVTYKYLPRIKEIEEKLEEIKKRK